ncbi:hypothetical protein [Streptomyces sp. NPDC047028]
MGAPSATGVVATADEPVGAGPPESAGLWTGVALSAGVGTWTGVGA